MDCSSCPERVPLYWRFYCYRCEQWVERQGPWCELYRDEPLIEECYFDEHPGHRSGVPFDRRPDDF